MRFLILIILSIIAVQFPYNTALACYSPLQAEAEKALRFQAEVMVISLYCKRSAAGGVRYAPPDEGNRHYYAFRKNTREILSEYEQIMLEYYRDNGSRVPEKNLDYLRSGFSNDIAAKAARMDRSTFCRDNYKTLVRASKMQAADLKNLAFSSVGDNPSSVRICAQKGY